MSIVKRAAEKAAEARRNIAAAVQGQEEAVELLLIALAARGHTLLEGVPGVGKTTLAKAFASTSGLGFSRVQLTPDLMPSDITGHSFFNQKTQSFEIRYGPAFTNLLLADEINRAPPRTQAALLEVMEERQVTIEGETLPVPDPFLVVATKNPIDIEGVYPLPEAQLDRFMLFIRMEYPDRQIERAILMGKLKVGGHVAATPDLVETLRQGFLAVRAHADIVNYVVEISRATRVHPHVELGAGPRASTHLLDAARGAALMEGRDFVVPDDVKRIARSVLAHRIHLSADAELTDVSKEDVVDSVLAETPVPLEVAQAHEAN